MSIEMQIRAKAKELGFSLVGFVTPDENPDRLVKLKEYIAKGSYGDMEWMAKEPEKRANPKILWDEVKSIICLGMNYYQENDGFSEDANTEGYISGYARGLDYHDFIMGRLKEFCSWLETKLNAQAKRYCDTAPVMEKPLGHQAGLGWQGKHSILISREIGNNFFLSEIFTDLELTPTNYEHPNHCGKCHKCVDACPTKAITGNYKIDASKCISYLTIENKGSIPVEYREAVGNRVYGCDSCLMVCPWNKFATPSDEEAFKIREAYKHIKLADLLQLNDEEFRKLFAHNPIKRIKRHRFLRNVCVAAGNSGDKSLIPYLQALIEEGNELISEHASWAIDKLNS